MARNIETFNEIVGLIFAFCYERFPEPTTLPSNLFVERLADNVSETDANLLTMFTIDFLVDEGFLRAAVIGDIKQTNTYVLTSRALLALNATPDFLQHSHGDELSDLAKKSADDARRSAVSKVVGEVIGYAFRAASF